LALLFYWLGHFIILEIYGENGIMIEKNAIIRATTYEISLVASQEIILVSREDNMIVIYDNDGGFVSLPLDSIEAVFNTAKRLL
jgi:hypothetical protein